MVNSISKTNQRSFRKILRLKPQDDASAVKKPQDQAPVMLSAAKHLYVIIAVALLNSSLCYANYQQAQALSARGDYTNAASEYYQSYSAPKNASEKVFAEWGLSQSLKALGYYYSASKFLSVIVRRGPGPHNPYFSRALAELGNINSAVSLGQAHMVQLFRTKIDPGSVPGPARGVYFYYLGVDAYNDQKFERAADHFKRVPSGSPYYLKAQFHLGIIANISGSHSRALGIFENVRGGADRESEGGAGLREAANLNIARVLYETKRYRDSLQYYAQIPRESDNWLQGIFESAWTFFMMAKHNNVLGNIHTIQSPFFENRFYPEGYILQAITFLRLCRFDEVKRTLVSFRERYRPVFKDVQNLLQNYKGNKRGFFKLVHDYKNGNLGSYKSTWDIFDSLARTDAYKEAGTAIRIADVEAARLSQAGGRWASTGLLDELKDFLNKKKSAAIEVASDLLYDKAAANYSYLVHLSDQTKLINLEMVLGRVDQLRRQLNVTQANPRDIFIGGLTPLQLDQQLEYWPFEGEYWEDELGYYVYNIGDKCEVAKPDKK